MKQYSPTYRKQAGGTFLGLILGLIIGLGIAVAVALMITKSPIPFVDKVGKQERGELSPGQMADPNKPLYGNQNVARETPKDQDHVATVDVREVEAQPAPDAALSNPASVHKSDGASDKWIYFLQTGAFRVQADADSARARLALLGFEAKVSERVFDNGTLYRVRIGPFPEVETMNRIRGRLSDNGVDAAVVRVPK